MVVKYPIQLPRWRRQCFAHPYVHGRPVIFFRSEDEYQFPGRLAWGERGQIMFDVDGVLTDDALNCCDVAQHANERFYRLTCTRSTLTLSSLCDGTSSDQASVFSPNPVLFGAAQAAASCSALVRGHVYRVIKVLLWRVARVVCIDGVQGHACSDTRPDVQNIKLAVSL